MLTEKELSALIQLYIEEREMSRHQDRLIFQIRVFTPTVSIALITLAINSRVYTILPLVSIFVLVAGLIDLRHSGYSAIFVRRSLELEKLLEKFSEENFLKKFEIQLENPYSPDIWQRGWLRYIPLTSKIPIILYSIFALAPLYLYTISW